MRAISTAYPNRNNSHFTKEALIKAIPTVYNKPLLGSFSVENDDFRQHNSELKWDNNLEQLYYDYTDPTSETPIGMIRSDDKVVVREDPETGESWLCFTASIWVKYNYKQVKSLLKSKKGKKKISVEIEVVESYEDEDGIEVITNFIFDGVTILGEAVQEGIAGAELSILDMVSSSLFQKKQKCLNYAYSELNQISPINTQQINNPIEKQDFNDIKKDEDNEVFSSDENIDDVNENKEEITMNQEGGNEKMLTYEAKRSLLEAYLSENVNCDNSCYCAWVCDLDDSIVYFSYEGKYFMAPYTISQDEEGNGSVIVNLEEKQAVVRSWTVFSEEGQDNQNNENLNSETFAENEDNKEENPEENKKTESCVDSTNCFEEVDDNKDSDDDSDDESDKDDNKYDDNKETESCENKETESCVDSTNCFEENKDEGSESQEEENKETESCDNKETESCVDSTNCFEDEENKEENPQDNKETESAEDENKEENPEDNKETESCVDSTNCFASQNENVTTETESSTTREFVMIDEEQVDIDNLLERYNALNEDYNALNQKFENLNNEYQTLFAQEQERQLNNMINFGYSLVDGETRLTNATQIESIKAIIKEKCENKEFADNDALKKFAVTQIALALYNADTEDDNSNNTNNSTKEFSVDIVKPEVKHIETGVEKLKNSMNKLKNI